MGLILPVVVSRNSFLVTNTPKASKLLGDQMFRSVWAEGGKSENYD
jgi:hypothetical protein